MTQAAQEWKPGVDWHGKVTKVLNYYAARPKLKYGPTRLDKAFPLIGDLCAQGIAPRELLKQRHEVTSDGVMTILSNVTMAIQGSKKVKSPAKGGWYTRSGTGSAITYVVCPGFSAAWRANGSPSP